MEASRGWRIFDRSLGVVGTVCTGIAAWYTYAAYRDQHPVPAGTKSAVGLAFVMPPWWVVALLIVGIAMLLVAWMRRRARIAVPHAENALASQEPAVGEAVAEQVKQKLHWQNTARVLSDEQEQLQGLLWRIEYDQNRPALPALNEQDAELARIEIARLTTALQSLKAALAPVSDDLVHRCLLRGDKENEFGASFADLFLEQVVRHCQRGFLFVERPQDYQIGPLEGFARWLWSYRKFREWVPRVTLGLGIEEADVRGYAAWREADAKLFEKFDDFALPWLRDSVHQHRQAGFPQNLNRPSAG